MYSESPAPTAGQELTTPTKRLRGFAAMSAEKMREIASLGGRTAHAVGHAHRFSVDEAREAGREGGRRISQDRAHMAEIGRRGGAQRSANRRSRSAAPELTLGLPGPGLPLLIALLLIAVAFPRTTAAQPMASEPMATPTQHPMPDAAPLTNFNPLCDSNLVHCLRIDHFAAHAYGHLQVLPKSERRDSAAVFPFGITLGLFGRVAGGISSSYSFWNEEDAPYHQLGPLRLSLVGRLLPLFPLLSSSSEPDSDSDFHPGPRGFQLGLAYEHEVRVGPFSGANSLGLSTDLASLHVVGSKLLGPFQISANLGALYDWHGSFATGSLAGQLGLFLPGFKQLKIFVDGMGRGFPVYAKKETLLSVPGGQDPIHPQGMVGGGLAFRMHQRVDLGVSVQRGFGTGIAPWAVSVQFLVLSVGKTYQGRAATPVAELAADLASEAATRLKEYIASLPIDPTLDENCFILDKDNVTVLGRFGKRTKNGYYCEEDGFRVPIGHEFERDRNKTKLCRDTDLKDCFLERRGKEWVPIHQPKLDASCDMYDTDGTYLGRVGKPTEDGRRCRYPIEKQNGSYGKYTTYEEQPIGEPFHTDADRSRVCVDEAMTHCFLKPPEGRRTLAVEGSERFAKRYDQDVSGDAQRAKDKVNQTANGVADGSISISTIAEEMRRAAKNAASKVADVAKDPGKAIADAKTKGAALVQAVEDWTNGPPEEQLDDLAHAAAQGTEEAVLGTAGHVVSGVVGGVRAAGTLEKAGEALADTAKAGKKTARRVEQVAEHQPSFRPTASAASDNLPGRHGAFRKAKQDAGIPRSQRPDAIVKPKMTDRWDNPVLDAQGRPIRTREYEFTRPDGKKIVIQDHGAGHKFDQDGVGDQGSHFNVRPADQRRTGQVPGTKGHYTFQGRQEP